MYTTDHEVHFTLFLGNFSYAKLQHIQLESHLMASSSQTRAVLSFEIAFRFSEFSRLRSQKAKLELLLCAVKHP